MGAWKAVRKSSHSLSAISATLAAACAAVLVMAAVPSLSQAANTRWVARSYSYGSNDKGGFVLGYLFGANEISGNTTANFVDVETIAFDANGEKFGYGRIGTNSAFGFGGSSRCAWVDIGLNSGMTDTGTPITPSCPSATDGHLAVSNLFQAGTYLIGCGGGCVEPAVVQPLCTDLTVYANYSPTTHTFSNPDGTEVAGRGSPAADWSTAQSQPPRTVTTEVPGFGTRYRTADGYAVMMKDTGRAGKVTPWGFMKSDCLTGYDSKNDVGVLRWPSESFPSQRPTSGVGAASWGSGRLDIFYRGPDQSLYHSWYGGGTWGGPESLGGSLGSDPRAVSWGDQRLDIAYTGTDGIVYHRWYDHGTWGGPEALPGGPVVGAPAIASWGVNRLDVFALSTGGQLLHQYFGSSGWSGWENLGGSYVSAPAAVSWGYLRIDLAVRATSSVSHIWYDGNWHSESLAAPASTLTWDPTITSWGVNRLDIFGVAPDHNMWQKTFDSSGWHNWMRVGGYANTSPGAVSWGAGRIDMFWVDGPRALMHGWMP